MTPEKSHNLLVISDLHLGEDLKPATKSRYLPHVPLLERELESFLDHYRKSRRDGRPWELIVNGDMVDFLSVCLFPEGGSAHDPDDKVWGIGSNADAARKKMEVVLTRHPGVFKALAKFVGAGNRLGIVAGNHDVEFHWPVVQETFRRGLGTVWAEQAASKRPGARTAPDVEADITFHPWFYFKEDICWIEHGHQYDSYCAFDFFTSPCEPNREEILLSVGAASYRYISNHVAGADPHQQEDWNALGYLRFSVGLGLKGLWRMFVGYAGMVGHMLSLWRLTNTQRDGVERRRKAHRERLREIAGRLRLQEETLVALDDLRQRPLISNLAKLAMAVMLDRVALVLFTLILTGVLLIVLPVLPALASVAGVFLVSGIAGQVLARLRGHTDPDEQMKTMPQKIRDHVRAPFVVFGHSHNPVALPLAGGGMYFNTGTWVATEKPGLLRAFTHVVIRHGETGAEASLCQWRDGRSTVYVPEAVAP